MLRKARWPTPQRRIVQCSRSRKAAAHEVAATQVGEEHAGKSGLKLQLKLEMAAEKSRALAKAYLDRAGVGECLLRWSEPPTLNQACRFRVQAGVNYETAAEQVCWDNFATARQLRTCAYDLEHLSQVVQLHLRVVR